MTAVGTDEHRESDFGRAAAVTDRGLRHHRNEDAYALEVGGEGRAVVVVCDGVSSSANPHQASAAAAVAAADALRPLLDAPPAEDHEVAGALRRAVAAASRAVGSVPPVEPGGRPAPPSTTIVAAVVDPGRVTVASVGDSRAYWLDPAAGTGRKLTVDDSLAEMAIAEGVPADAAYSLPQAHVITRWLGVGARPGDPEVAIYTPGTEGVLLVCSDGLWNYHETPESLVGLLQGDMAVPPIAMARTLVDAALAAGGGDNITVAVVDLSAS